MRTPALLRSMAAALLGSVLLAAPAHADEEIFTAATSAPVLVSGPSSPDNDLAPIWSLSADDVASLHGDSNNITKATALDETGAVINGRGDTPNRHDILTGSAADGTAVAETCGNWTMGGAEGAAMMGHSDRMGPETLPTGKSWNHAHASRGGCSQEAFAGTGGDGLFYCFVAN